MEKRRCPAMVEAGIEDPTSQEGIDFCTDHCPYDRCIAFDSERDSSTRKDARVKATKDMAAKGYSELEIARVLKKSIRTIYRYLAE